MASFAFGPERQHGVMVVLGVAAVDIFPLLGRFVVAVGSLAHHPGSSVVVENGLLEFGSSPVVAVHSLA